MVKIVHLHFIEACFDHYGLYCKWFILTFNEYFVRIIKTKQLKKYSLNKQKKNKYIYISMKWCTDRVREDIIYRDTMTSKNTQRVEASCNLRSWKIT